MARGIWPESEQEDFCKKRDCRSLLQAEVAKTRAQNGTQISEIEKLTQLASSLQQKQIEASGKVADEDTRPVIAKLEGQNASLHAQLSEQKNVLGQQSARSSSEQKADSKRVSPEGSVESGARSPESLAGTQQLRKQASDLEKENSLLRKQLSLLEGNGTDTRFENVTFAITCLDADSSCRSSCRDLRACRQGLTQLRKSLGREI